MQQLFSYIYVCKEKLKVELNNHALHKPTIFIILSSKIVELIEKEIEYMDRDSQPMMLCWALVDLNHLMTSFPLALIVWFKLTYGIWWTLLLTFLFHPWSLGLHAEVLVSPGHISWNQNPKKRNLTEIYKKPICSYFPKLEKAQTKTNWEPNARIS